MPMFRSFLVKGSNVPLRPNSAAVQFQAEPSTMYAVTNLLSADRKV
jgi:hypothetical protein